MSTDSENYISKVLGSFEQLGDRRLEDDIGAIKDAARHRQFEHAANVLIPRLYEKHKALTLTDMLAILPVNGFERPRSLIAERAYRAAANEILHLIQTAAWRPSAREWRILRDFWDYFAG